MTTTTVLNFNFLSREIGALSSSVYHPAVYYIYYIPVHSVISRQRSARSKYMHYIMCTFNIRVRITFEKPWVHLK